MVFLIPVTTLSCVEVKVLQSQNYEKAVGITLGIFQPVKT